MQQRDARLFISDSSVQVSRKSENHTPQQYSVLNISRGGLCFKSNEPFELNEQVNLSVTIKQQNVLTANGRICYCNDTGGKDESNYGLSFLDHFIDADFLRSHKQSYPR